MPESWRLRSLPLGAFAILAGSGAVGFAALSGIVAWAAGPTPVDAWVRGWATAQAWMPAVGAWFSFWDPRIVQLAVLGAVVLLLRLRRWVLASAAVVLMVVPEFLLDWLKALFGRARPGDAASTTSFPSGHAAAATVEWGIVFLLAFPAMTESTRARGWGIAAWAGLAVLAGVARLLEDVHWITDVAAGWAFGCVALGLAGLACGVAQGTAAAAREERGPSTSVRSPE